MSRQVSLFSFYGNPTKKRKISDSPNNDNVVVRQLLNDLVNDVVKEVKRNAKKSITDDAMSNEKIVKWRKKFMFWDTPGGKVCVIFDE